MSVHASLRAAITLPVAMLITAPLEAAEPAAKAPSFTREVVPVLAKLGCNAGGACHGTVFGQGGLRLSLFGGLPALDHERLTREVLGRRLNPLHPDQSLMLLKATGQVNHGGGKRTSVGSPDYTLLRDWIAAGAPLDKQEDSALKSLAVEPVEQIVHPEGNYRLKVEATYRDGSRADVTAFCRFEVQATEIVSVDGTGLVRAHNLGDTAIVVRYGIEPVIAQAVVVPAKKKGFPAVKPHNFIDTHVLAKLQALDIPPAPLCDDATFLRRLYLDVTGRLPEPDEVHAFLENKDPGKRAKKIEAVLGKPGYAELWAAKFSDLIKPVERGNDGSNNILAGQLLRIRFYEWLRARLQENVPYDKLVERILVSNTMEDRTLDDWIKEHQALAAETTEARKKQRPLTEPLLSGYNARRTLDLYWQRDGATGVPGAVQFAHSFLGLRLQCAQCHRHPYDVWQQEDLLSFANFFTSTRSGGGPNSKAVAAQLDKLKDEMKKWDAQVKELSKSKDAADKARAASLQAKLSALRELASSEVTPLTGGIQAASVRNSLGSQSSRELRLLGQPSLPVPAVDVDRRQLIMDWLRKPDNPFFARALVNRVWAHYLGRGIVDPPDHLSPLNPPTHPRLLDELTQGFVKNNYDLKWLHRTILQSRTYQQSHEGSEAGSLDNRNYARFYLRRLPGEIILDLLNDATGAQEKYSSNWLLRDGERGLLAAGVMVDVVYYRLITEPFRYMTFGRERRRTSVQCDCEQGREATLPQLLFLANHPEVRGKIENDKGRVALVAADAKRNDAQRVEELFLRALGRPPSAPELQAALEHLKTSASLRKGLEDVLWGLLNTREFQVNY